MWRMTGTKNSQQHSDPAFKISICLLAFGSSGAIKGKEPAASDPDGLRGVAQIGRGEFGLHLRAVKAPAGGRGAKRRAIREYSEFALRSDAESSVGPDN